MACRSVEGLLYSKNSMFRVNHDPDMAYVHENKHMLLLNTRSSTSFPQRSLSSISRQRLAYSSGLVRADTSVASRRSPAPHHLVPPGRPGQVWLLSLPVLAGSSHFTTPLPTPANLTRPPNTRLCQVRNRPLPPSATSERSLDCASSA
jgi:hypothetical protein